MLNYAGFYEPATIEDSQEDGERLPNTSNFRKVFALITERTGWTPDEIGSLTLKQLNHYITAWVEEAGDRKNNESSADEMEIKKFNTFAGIPTIRKQSK